MQKFIGLVVVYLLLSSCLLAQTAQITGTVRSESTRAGEPEPLPGANIVLKGQQKGTSTNAQGQFTIQTSAPGQVLVISAIGYQTTEVKVDDANASTG